MSSCARREPPHASWLGLQTEQLLSTAEGLRAEVAKLREDNLHLAAQGVASQVGAAAKRFLFERKRSLIRAASGLCEVSCSPIRQGTKAHVAETYPVPGMATGKRATAAAAAGRAAAAAQLHA